MTCVDSRRIIYKLHLYVQAVVNTSIEILMQLQWSHFDYSVSVVCIYDILILRRLLPGSIKEKWKKRLKEFEENKH